MCQVVKLSDYDAAIEEEINQFLDYDAEWVDQVDPDVTDDELESIMEQAKWTIGPMGPRVGQRSQFMGQMLRDKIRR